MLLLSPLVGHAFLSTTAYHASDSRLFERCSHCRPPEVSAALSELQQRFPSLAKLGDLFARNRPLCGQSAQGNKSGPVAGTSKFGPAPAVGNLPGAASKSPWRVSSREGQAGRKDIGCAPLKCTMLIPTHSLRHDPGVTHVLLQQGQELACADSEGDGRDPGGSQGCAAGGGGGPRDWLLPGIADGGHQREGAQCHRSQRCRQRQAPAAAARRRPCRPVAALRQATSLALQHDTLVGGASCTSVLDETGLVWDQPPLWKCEMSFAAGQS